MDSAASNFHSLRESIEFMAQTYADLQEQIAQLQTEANQVRQAELAAVITKMRDDIRIYEIKPQDLFGKIAAKASKNPAAANAAPKFSDGKGNHWVGRGPRPQWLRDALAAGRRLEEFVFGSSAPKAESAVAVEVKKAAPKKVAAKMPAPKKPKAKAPAAKK